MNLMIYNDNVKLKYLRDEFCMLRKVLGKLFEHVFLNENIKLIGENKISNQEKLLGHILHDLIIKLSEKKVTRTKDKYTVTFSHPEAFAFMIFWEKPQIKELMQSDDITLAYTQNILQNTFNQLHKHYI